MKSSNRCGTSQTASAPAASSDSPHLDLGDHTVAVAMIQALIPLGLRAVEDALQQEVTALAGTCYAHTRTGVVRWGAQRGSVYVAAFAVRFPLWRYDCFRFGKAPGVSF